MPSVSITTGSTELKLKNPTRTIPSNTTVEYSGDSNELQDILEQLCFCEGADFSYTVNYGFDIRDAVSGGIIGRTKFVATNGSDTEGDGSIEKPYATWQKAHDEAVALTPSPSQNNPVGVIGFPGRYNQQLIVDGDNVVIHGLGGQQGCLLRPDSGPALIITNATRASVATFLANGGDSDPAAHYTDLSAHGSNMPRNLQIRNMDFGKPSGGATYDIMTLGVGDGISFGGSEFNFFRCCCWNNIYTRTTNYFSWQGASWCAKKIVAFNTAGVWANDCQTSGYEGDYDTGEDQPSDSGNYGLCGGKHFCNGNIVLNGTAKAGGDDPNGGLGLIYVAGNLDLNEECSLNMIGGAIRGNITAEADSSFMLRGTHVQGNITIASGGSGTCQMDAGAYMGSLTDTGGKLTRNAGN